MSKWRDQHLKTCACRKCSRKPTHVSDHPVLNAKAQVSKLRDEIVYQGKGAYVQTWDDLPATKAAAASAVEISEWMDKYLFAPQPGLASDLVPKGKSDFFTTQTASAATIKLSPFFITTVTSYSIAGWPSPEPPTLELIDTTNPFAKVLDAWQTGKAGWTKGATFRRTQPEGAPA